MQTLDTFVITFFAYSDPIEISCSKKRFDISFFYLSFRSNIREYYIINIFKGIHGLKS